MPELAWPISAVVGWIIFFLLVDWSRFKYTIWGGLIASSTQLLVDTGAMYFNFYRIEPFIGIWGSSATFTFGVVFIIGILYAQTLPASSLLQGISIVVLATIFSLQEYLFVEVGALEYIQWEPWASLFINILIFTFFTWLFGALGLNRRGRIAGGGYRI